MLSQTLKEIEIICVDDGSTDGTLSFLMDYKEKYSNVIVLHQENQGSGPARNRGIECARGKYVCFMDSDDYFAQNGALEHLYINAEENHVPVCRGNFLSVLENGEIKRALPWFSEKKMLSVKEDGCFSYYQCHIFSLELIRENNIRFPAYRRFQDPPFFLEVMSCAQVFLAIDEPIYVYRQWEKGIKWTENIVADVLKGICDCFRIAQKNNLTKIYDKYLKNILSSYLWIIYPHACQGKLWDLIDEINRINVEWMGEYPPIFQNKESLEAYVAPLREKRDHMISMCQKAEEVVIYGTGEVGRFFLQSFGKECGHIAGFAASDKESEDFIDGYEVREIGEYSRKSLIVVAVIPRNAKEVLQNLEQMQFENVCYIEYATLKLIKRIFR
ncbi:MAG: glycosyltransferase [Ruminococcus flavefaciens]|nr:glycosyltransferase [Ruminococcus flavefaciens]